LRLWGALTACSVGLLAAAAAAACGFSITGGGGPAGVVEAGSEDGAPGGGDGGLPGVDGAVNTGPVVCPWPTLEQGAVWPMVGGCVDHQGRTIFDGPHQKPSVRFVADVRRVYRSIPIATADGTILVNADVEGVIGVDPSDGGTFRRVDAGPSGSNITNAPAIGRNGMLFYGAGTFVVGYADPTRAWRFDTGGQEVDTSVALTADGLVIAGSLNDRLYALDSADGGKRWERELHGDVDSSPAINRITGTIYTCGGNHCYAIKPDGGDEWDYNASTSMNPGAPVLGLDGTVHVMTSGGELRALRPGDKSVKWTYRTNGPGPTIWHLPAAVGLDGTIYTGQSNTLVALNPETGLPRWEANADQTIRTSILIDGSDVIYVGTTQNNVIAFDSGGKELWRLTLAAQPENFVIGRNGTLYVACTNNLLYALN
jgi:outer membrane protein assembly factor BamB